MASLKEMQSSDTPFEERLASSFQFYESRMDGLQECLKSPLRLRNMDHPAGLESGLERPDLARDSQCVAARTLAPIREASHLHRTTSVRRSVVDAAIGVGVDKCDSQDPLNNRRGIPLVATFPGSWPASPSLRTGESTLHGSSCCCRPVSSARVPSRGSSALTY